MQWYYIRIQSHCGGKTTCIKTQEHLKACGCITCWGKRMQHWSVCAQGSCVCVCVCVCVRTYPWSRWLPGRCLCPPPGAVAGTHPHSHWAASGWTDSALAGTANRLRSPAARSDTPPSPLWGGVRQEKWQMSHKEKMWRWHPKVVTEAEEWAFMEMMLLI